MKKIGYYGFPPREIIDYYKSKGYEFVDLDIDFSYKNTEILPKTTCQIIKNIVTNAINKRDEIEKIIATTGKDKCDNGFFVANILKELDFDVIFTENTNKNRKDTPISDSVLSLSKKIDLIMQGIVKKIDTSVYKKAYNPKFGFWGVPPNDFSILDIFPDDTIVLGWVRAVEAEVPSDIELEMYVPDGLKIVFFVQSFCSKSILAKYLAEKYNGLYIDLDRNATISIKSKIEAFIRLNQ